MTAPWRTWLRLLALCVLLANAAPTQAHKASDAYLVLGETTQVQTNAVKRTVQLSIALKDVDAAIDSLDADQDRQLTWGEVKAATPPIIAWVSSGVSLQCASQAVALTWAFESLERRADGTYLRLGSAVPACAGALTLTYRLMRGIDSTHRLLISGQLGGKQIAAVLDPQTRPQLVLSNTSQAAPSTAADSAATLPQTGLATLTHFFGEGVHHLITGYDHLAFLLVLLLPIMLVRRLPAGGVSAANMRPGLIMLIRTVTGFTIGHSATLIASSLGWIAAASSWVEPTIAITIAISALLNLHPIRWVRGDMLALVFGLIHGLGFSSIMIEAGISGSLLFWALAGFNLGIEAGQLAGLAVWCALHLALARWRHYELIVIKGGSLALLLVAIYWTVQRVGAP